MYSGIGTAGIVSNKQKHCIVYDRSQLLFSKKMSYKLYFGHTNSMSHIFMEVRFIHPCFMSLKT